MLFTDIPLEKIEEYSKLSGEKLNSVKEILAYEATKICRGENEANSAKNREITNQILVKSGEKIIDILVKNNICKSNGEARRLIEGNGIKFNKNTIDKNFTFNEDGLLQIGKKRNINIKLS